MRRVIVLMLLAGLALSNVGCVIAIGTKEVPHHKRVVAVDGEIYIVDVRTQGIRKIDADWDAEDETPADTELEQRED